MGTKGVPTAVPGAVFEEPRRPVRAERLWVWAGPASGLRRPRRRPEVRAVKRHAGRAGGAALRRPESSQGRFCQIAPSKGLKTARPAIQ